MECKESSHRNLTCKKISNTSLQRFNQDQRVKLLLVATMLLSSESVRGGSILWLINPFDNPDQEDSDDEPVDLPETFNGVETGLLGHPVMVLHKLDGTTDVAVCLVSLILYWVVLLCIHLIIKYKL